MFRQFKRYGFWEIVLTTHYRHESFHKRTPSHQLRVIARQVRALGTYCLSLVVRLCRWRRWQSDRMYLAWPVFWFVLDSGNLLGKLEALIATRCFQKDLVPTL